MESGPLFPAKTSRRSLWRGYDSAGMVREGKPLAYSIWENQRTGLSKVYR